ncbi:unnamed protein product [Closterium sp. NIES-54]
MRQAQGQHPPLVQPEPSGPASAAAAAVTDCYRPQRHRQHDDGENKRITSSPPAHAVKMPLARCSWPPGPSAPATATATTAATTAAAPAATATAATATAAITAPACCATMASLRVLAFDHEGRPIQFDTWLDDLQLYLLSNSKKSVSLFDLASGTAPAPPATAEAQALYDAVVSRYSSPATAALGRLLLPYLFPELSSFDTVEDLVSHLRTSDARYRATVPAEFLDRNQPPMFITLYFIVTRLPDSLRSVRDHFLSLDPTSLTVDLLKEHLLAAKTNAVAVDAARGTPRTPFFEGCSPSPLAPSYAFAAAAADVAGAEDVGAASASAKRRSGKGKGSKGGGGGSGSGGGGSSGGSGGGGGGGSSGSGGGSGGVSGGGGGSGGSGGSGGGGTGGGKTGARRGGSGGGQRHQQQRRSETQWPQQLREWLFQRETSGGSDSCPYVICTDLLRPRVVIVDLDFDVILSAMYALSASAEGDCYRCVPPDPGIAAAALGASESALPGTAPAEALHTFTLDSGASHCFFHDNTTLTPLPAPVPVRLADPSTGPDVARSSIVLSCPADAMVTTTTPGGQRVLICTCTWTGRHLATFTRQPGSSLYTLATKPPQVAASAQVSASLPPLPPSPVPPCLPCLEGRQRAAPYSSSFPPTTAPLQTLHMDVWGPASVNEQGRKRYTRYTTVFPLCSKGEVPDFLIPWIRGVRLQLRERFSTDLPLLRLHFDRGGEFSSDLLRDLGRGEGILQTFTLPAFPQQNGIAERRIGLVMEVARTSMIHAAAPHFLWRFAVWYDAHHINLWPRVSLPETLPTLRWTGQVGDASVFRVCGSRAFVRDMSADKLSARAIPCVFLGFPPDAPGCQFYHPTSCRVFPSQDVTFDESVPFYRLFPYHSAPPPPLPLFFAPGPPPVDPLLPQGLAPSGVSQVDPLPGTVSIEVVGDSGAARGAEPGGAEPGGVESEGAGSGVTEPGGAEPGGAERVGVEPGGAEPEGVELGGAESEGAESGGAEPRCAASSGDSGGAWPRLSLQQLREWLVRRARLRSGATGAGGAGAARAGGAGVTTGAGGTGGTAATCPGGACTRGTGAAGTGGVGDARAGASSSGTAGAGARGAGVGGTGAGGAGAGGDGAVGPGETVRPQPYYPASPHSAPSPYTEQSGGLTEHREPASHPVSPVHTARRVPRSRPPPVPGTHAMALRPSSVPLHLPLPAPPTSSLPASPEPESDCARVASPTVSRLLATAVTDPSFETAAASALVVELLDCVGACCLDYATALVAKSESASPPSVGGECALGTEVLEDKQEDFECLAAAVSRFASMMLAPEGDPDAPDIPIPCSYAEAITGPYSSQWQAAMDVEMASWKSTGTYVDEVPPPGANIVDGMWIFRVKRPPGSLPAFKAHYVARGFSQRQGVDYFQTFSPTPKMTTLRVLLHVIAQRDYELHSLDFSIAFLQGSLHEEIWLRRPPGFTGSFPAGTQWSLRRPVYGLRQAPREWHDTLRTTLAALGFAPFTADPSLFLHTDTSLSPFYVLVYVDDLVFATAHIEALTLVNSEVQKRHTCTDLGKLRSYLGLQITRDRARRTITLTRPHMVHQVLQRFDF